MDQKRPLTDVERVTCLAFYLAHVRSTPHFKTSDITALNTEAAQLAFSNASYAIANAESSHYVTKAGKRGQKQITSFGEKVVNALPDREAVKAVVDAESKAGARRKKLNSRRKKKAVKKKAPA